MAILSNDIRKQVAEALGLKKATKIEIVLALGDIARVNVTYYPDEESIKRIIPIFQEYELVKKTGK